MKSRLYLGIVALSIFHTTNIVNNNELKYLFRNRMNIILTFLSDTKGKNKPRQQLFQVSLRDVNLNRILIM